MKFYFDGILEGNSLLPHLIEKKEEGLIEVKAIAELLNADLLEVKGVVWSGQDVASLEEIIPKKRTYGWMLASFTKSIYIRIENEAELIRYQNIKCDGYISSSLEMIKLLAQKFNG